MAERVEDLETVIGLAADGVLRPVIDATFPFERIVDAHRRVETGRKRGAVVVVVSPPP